MGENAPPPTTTATSSSTDATRGIPYYEKLRRDLRESLQKKRTLDASIHSIEESIYRMETAYLEDTGAGNIIKGFDNYIKGSSAGGGAGSSALGGGGMGAGGGTTTRRKGGIGDADRIFSKSSANFNRDSPAPSASTTPSHAPTPASSLPQSARESNQPTPTNTTGGATKAAAANKKKKAAVEKEEEEDSKPVKRNKLS